MLGGRKYLRYEISVFKVKPAGDKMVIVLVNKYANKRVKILAFSERSAPKLAEYEQYVNIVHPSTHTAN